ncbi:gatA [Symbiodinium sp. KB8]|nr:gatA [Symbiodinium sp. KB8]
MFRRFVRRARAAEPSLNAYVDLAKEEEEDGPTGPVTGLLGGVPLGAKASFCVEGTVSDACSDVLGRYRPPYTATAPARLLESGCRLVGKHNQDEFAMGAANLYSAAGPAVNPHSPGLLDARHKAILTPGGSSGGSAAAVAAGSCLVALGSDTGGSVRLPAAYCGVVGLKPTYGRLSRHGLIAFASSLDTPGVLARCVADAALALDAAAGTDPLDDTTVRQSRIAPEALPTRADIARMLDSPAGQPVSVSSAAAAAPGAFSPALVHARRPTATGRSAAGPDAPLPEGLRAAIAGKRVGILAECHVAELPEAALRSWQEGARWLEDAGAVVVPVSVPEVRTALPAYYVLAPAEAASNLSRFDGVRYGLRAEGAAPAEGEGDAAGRSTGGLERMYTATRSEGFGPEVQRRILAGNFVLSAEAKSSYYDAAVAARRALRLAMEGLFGQGGVSHLAEEAALGVMLGGPGCRSAPAREAVAGWAACSPGEQDQLVDLVLTPTAPAGQSSGAAVADPLAQYLGDVMTVAANLADLPAVSVPVGMTELSGSGASLPTGLQLMAARQDERTLLHAAAVLEWYAPFATRAVWPWDERA